MNYCDDINMKKDEMGLAARIKQITRHANVKGDLFGKLKE
jgi:hypothetical protein